MSKTSLYPQSPEGAVSRRTILAGAAAAIAAGMPLAGLPVMAGAAAPAAVVPHAAGFLKLSEFLTGGQPLAATLADRYRAVLTRMDPTFDARAAELERYVADAGAADIDALLERPDLSDPLKKSIQQIVSAWYLGIVANDKNAELVSYADALMYRPTIDVLVVPSYGGGPDSWGQKPPVSTVPNAVLLEELNKKKP